jgi:hypothetical protein
VWIAFDALFSLFQFLGLVVRFFPTNPRMLRVLRPSSAFQAFAVRTDEATMMPQQSSLNNEFKTGTFERPLLCGGAESSCLAVVGCCSCTKLVGRYERFGQSVLGQSAPI